MFKNVLLAAAIVASASAAQAVTFTSIASPTNPAYDPGIPKGSTLLADFNGNLGNGLSLTGAYAYKDMTTQNVAAAPSGDKTRFLYVSSALAPGIATLSSQAGLSRIGFYWGSIDTYNTVTVLGTKNGGAQKELYTLSGTDLMPANGNQFLTDTNRRVTFTVGGGEVINGLRFASAGVAFELDDVAGRLAGNGSGSTVPEPASWAMMLAGFGLVGFATRRRRGMASVAA